MKRPFSVTIILLVIIYPQLAIFSCSDHETETSSLERGLVQLAGIDGPTRTNIDTSDVDLDTMKNDFIDALRDHMVDNSLGYDDVVVDWNYTNNVKLLYGDGFAVSLDSIGCTNSSVLSSLRCFLSEYGSYFGIPDTTDSSLRYLRQTRHGGGSTIYRFRHYASGYRIRGSDVVMTIDRDGGLSRVYSKFVSNLDVQLSEYNDLISLFSGIDTAELYEDVMNNLGYDTLNVVGSKYMIYVDRAKRSTKGYPAISLTLSSPTNKVIIADALTAEIYEVFNRYSNYDADVIIRTTSLYVDAPGGTCPPDCDEEEDESCSYHFDPYYKCVVECAEDSDCSVHGDDWSCWTGVADANGYCYLDTATTDEWYKSKLTFDGTSWYPLVYSTHQRYQAAKTKMEDVRKFHYDYPDGLGRNSWDDGDSDYTTIFWTICNEVVGCWHRGSGAANGTITTVGNWYYIHFVADQWRSRSYHLLSHEWGHNIGRSIIDPDDGYDDPCFNEAIAGMFGSLLSTYKVGGDEPSSVQWTEEGDTKSPWYDEAEGLNGDMFDPLIPYSHRSRFDWLDCDGTGSQASCDAQNPCPPYEECLSGNCSNRADSHNNDRIWKRFMRILHEGPDTFDNDDNDEDIKCNFTGVDWQTTVDVVYDAILNISSSTDLEDWVGLLKSAGSTNGVSNEVKFSLGAIGFLTATYNGHSGGNKTDKAPYRYRFDAWQGSPSKWFYVYKVRGSGDIKAVCYKPGTTVYVYTISANTDSGPAVVVYNSKLHIFWKDKTTDAIKFLYINADSTTSSIYDLGSKNIKANDSFDATEFNGSLYLVYDHGSGDVYVSKCGRRSGGCTAGTEWYHGQDWSYNYRKSLGWQVKSGTIGAAAATGLNGVGSSTTKYLYVASAARNSPDAYEIRIDQVNTSDAKTHTLKMSESYPSYKTAKEIGLVRVTTAFPEDAGDYLYLSWKDYSTTKIYKAVVQEYDDDDNEYSWITRPHYIFRDTATGVRLSKDVGPTYENTYYSWTSTSNYMYYSPLLCVY